MAKATIANFEAEKRSPYPRTLEDLQRALSEAGITFLPDGGMIDGGPGVRLARRSE